MVRQHQVSHRRRLLVSPPPPPVQSRLESYWTVGHQDAENAYGMIGTTGGVGLRSTNPCLVHSSFHLSNQVCSYPKEIVTDWSNFQSSNPMIQQSSSTRPHSYHYEDYPLAEAPYSFYNHQKFMSKKNVERRDVKFEDQKSERSTRTEFIDSIKDWKVEGCEEDSEGDDGQFVLKPTKAYQKKIYEQRRGSGINSAEQKIGEEKKPSKLKRRQAYYREKRNQGRSRSLTHIDKLESPVTTGMVFGLESDEMESHSEHDTNDEHLLVVPKSITTGGEPKDNRRKKLARSQVSSSEFFSVSFEGNLGSGLEEFLPAIRGVALGEALRPLLDKKNVSISSVEIYVDSSRTPLPSPSTTDTFIVAGKNIRIRLKDASDSLKFHSRSFKESRSHHQTTSTKVKSKFFSSSAEDPSITMNSPSCSSNILEPSSPGSSSCSAIPIRHAHSTASSTLHLGGSFSHEGSIKNKSSSKQSNRWSGLFSNSPKDNSKMEILVEQLNKFSKVGIPPLSSLLQEGLECEKNELELDDSVMNYIQCWDELEDRTRQQQTAIWELVETELVYLRTIKVITDLFLSCLCALQSLNILGDIDCDQLFSNIPSIYKANKLLWSSCFLPIIQKAKESRKLLSPSDLKSGFMNFGTIGEPYVKYCLDQSNCQKYCRQKYQENELFKAYLAWCETRKECNRLKLIDILVQPMQRMTKYSLLLKAILKNTSNQDDKVALEQMIHSVEKFVKSVNGALRSRQDSEKLQGISQRIEAYDVVETREDELEAFVKVHSKLDLFQPMIGCDGKQRWLIHEGDLKLKDYNTKVDVHGFLFTDFLMICKNVGKKGDKVRIIRQPYLVDRILICELNKDASSAPTSFGLVYLNEFGTPVTAFTLSPSDSKDTRNWLEQLKEAQKFYAQAKRKEIDFSQEIYDDDGNVYLSFRSPREGSSRVSQLSSLIHSQSGSVELEASALSSRGLSLEHEQRGSSLSSDDGNEGGGTSGRLEGTCPTRRRFLSKSPTPNTLSVQIPMRCISGQSLPNLSSSIETLHQSTSSHSLIVPPNTKSSGFNQTTHRGISYPPPSPRNLTRSSAITQLRNPPLQKSKNITSPEYSSSMEITTGPTTSVNLPAIAKTVEYPGDTTSPSTVQLKQFSFDEGNGKRQGRSGDTKRYHTAGAIEDFKKEYSKNANIQKRFSWNYGAQAQKSPPSAVDQLKDRNSFSESMMSVRSSSGVSSNGSLLHSISDLEIDEQPKVILQHHDVRIDVSEPPIQRQLGSLGESFHQFPLSSTNATNPNP